MSPRRVSKPVFILNGHDYSESVYRLEMDTDSRGMSRLRVDVFGLDMASLSWDEVKISASPDAKRWPAEEFAYLIHDVRCVYRAEPGETDSLSTLTAHRLHKF